MLFIGYIIMSSVYNCSLIQPMLSFDVSMYIEDNAIQELKQSETDRHCKNSYVIKTEHVAEPSINEVVGKKD